MSGVLGRLRSWYWRLGHEVYEHEQRVDWTPVGAADEIQAALDASTPPEFRRARQHYEQSRFRWFLKEPVLTSTVLIGPEVYQVSRPLVIPAGVRLKGTG